MLLDEHEKNVFVDFFSKSKGRAKTIEPKDVTFNKYKREAVIFQDYQKIIEDQQKLINSKSDIMRNVIGRKDTSLAHSDAKIFLIIQMIPSENIL